MKLIHILAIMAIEAVLLCAGVSVASRNSSGTMSGINGPYVAGTVISSSVINARLADIESELTDSASRSGKGGFTAPVRGADGTVTAPTFAFTSETGTGLYRIGSSDLGVSINQSKKLELTGSLFTVTPAASFSSTLATVGAITTTLASSVNGGITLLSGGAGNFTSYALGRAASEFQIGISNGSNGYCVGTSAGDTCLVTSAGTKAIFLDSNGGVGTPSLKVAAGNAGVLVAGGLTIGSSGTAIGTSSQGSSSLTPGSITGGTCYSVGQTIAGGAAGVPCALGLPANPTDSLIYKCFVTSATSCGITICNPTAGAITAVSGTYMCRVFN